MADARDSKSLEGNFMRVRPPPPAPKKKLRLLFILKTSFKISFVACFFFYATKRNSHFIGELVATLLRIIFVCAFISYFFVFHCSFSRRNFESLGTSTPVGASETLLTAERPPPPAPNKNNPNR